MQCPKCANEMTPLEGLPASAHRCTHCQGLWLEIMAHEHLQPLAEQVDTGSADVGREFNRIDRIHCPSCAGEQDLIRMVDPQQPHIWFESCQSCFGRFYDAGEFVDLSELTLKEWFADLSAPERPL